METDNDFNVQFHLLDEPFLGVHVTYKVLNWAAPRSVQSFLDVWS